MAMMQWSFDQGRLDYFQFDELKKIACALSEVDGIKQPVRDEDDILREVLAKYSDLPFLPSNYFVWRNYGRVFGCLLLATTNKGHILATDLCKQIAADPENIDPDDYFSHFARNFYYSSPVFSGYQQFGPQAFPVIAVIKFLISEKLRGKSFISIDEIFSYLISNNVTGLEDIKFYSTLTKNPISVSADAIRQVRELVKFISQFSFLKWENPNLYIEIESKEELLKVEQSLKPVINVRNTSPSLEILSMGSGFGANTLGHITLNHVGTTEEEFTEGSKIRVAHLRTERSVKLKNLYFKKTAQPQICRSCSCDTSKRYPWAKHVIEVHHLLPLASPVRVEKGTTSLKDLVGLCPSCHRATHLYYSKWFKKKGVKDFSNYVEAVAVFNKAKAAIVLP